MAKKKRKKRTRKPYTGKNRHHLLFQARYWSKGDAKILHNQFVYLLDVKIHDELHNAVLKNITKPSSDAIRSILNAFYEQRREIERLDIVGASEWLQNACVEEPFHSQMQVQTIFLKERLKK